MRYIINPICAVFSSRLALVVCCGNRDIAPIALITCARFLVAHITQEFLDHLVSKVMNRFWQTKTYHPFSIMSVIRAQIAIIRKLYRSIIINADIVLQQLRDSWA